MPSRGRIGFAVLSGGVAAIVLSWVGAAAWWAASDGVEGKPAGGSAPQKQSGSSADSRGTTELQLRPNPLRAARLPAASRAATSSARQPAGKQLAASKDEPGNTQEAAGKAGEPALAERLGPAPKAAPAKARKGKHSGEPFDPIKENGPIFQGWPKPRLAVVLSGRQDGYLEPCGCAGLDRMKGGVARRYTLFEQLRANGWPLAALDAGGLVKSYGRQTEIKLQITAEAMRKMGYGAIALGKADLRLPAPELAAVVAGVPGQESPFLSANAALFGFDAAITPRWRVIEAGGLKLGVTAVLGRQAIQELHNPEVQTIDPEAALNKVLPELLEQKCDLLFLLAHATLEESEELARKFPAFQFVVTAGGAPEPPLESPRQIGGHNYLVEVGEKGMHVIVLGFYTAPQGKLQMRYQRVPLDSRFALAGEMKALMKAYQDQLQTLGLAGLGIKPAPNPRAELLGAYVGSAKCESCHEPSYIIWKKSGHAKAYRTLVEADPPRNFDPECISCHVVGWHPTQYFPYKGGFLSKEKTPHLTDVGCESCHGPGEAHCHAELKDDEALKEKLRKAMVLTKAEAQKRFCYECHDLDNSPDFDFQTYWPLVEHYEKE